ncbi:acylphosphatase [Bacillus ginsengihumi]|uniref:acylphosphatase n=1 Tax=Heyndrickxia ginsengihumi TaxID=363870 RepID=A0A0A6VCI6_9BACI|nr:acylphosphatase [Heyndrickxia ginsengihumi]KHD85203.1 acylphosphatase [Heyndrickxia ginsengihumi]NEY19707.1 acylphosphatase [Heyndrickxia ginsengihumi]
MDQLKRVHIVVSGRVQGVGFRFQTQWLAKQYDIRGWVKNTHDGKVEIEAESTETNLEKFISAIKKGPTPFAKVTNIDISYFSDLKHDTSFRILY